MNQNHKNPTETSENSRSTNKSGDNGITDANLDTVRDILFGAQAKETTRKQLALENQIHTATHVLRKETQQNFIAVAQDIDTLKDHLNDETATRRDERSVTLKRLDSIDERIDQLKLQITTVNETLVSMITSENRRTTEAMAEWGKGLEQHMSEIEKRLKAEKADKKALATLFSQCSEELGK